MQHSRSIPQHTEELSPQVPCEAAGIGSLHAASRQAAVPEPKADRRGSRFGRFFRWIAGKIVQDVPDDSALCQFDCRKEQCTREEWACCQRRLTDAAGELWPGPERPASEPAPLVHPPETQDAERPQAARL
jgi:hypothetical protein